MEKNCCPMCRHAWGGLSTKQVRCCFYLFPPILPIVEYFRNLLRAVPAGNVLFDFFLAFSHSKIFKFAFSLGEFHLQSALSLLKCILFLFLPHACPAFLKYTLQIESRCNEFITTISYLGGDRTKFLGGPRFFREGKKFTDNRDFNDLKMNCGGPFV